MIFGEIEVLILQKNFQTQSTWSNIPFSADMVAVFSSIHISMRARAHTHTHTHTPHYLALPPSCSIMVVRHTEQYYLYIVV